MGEEGKVAWDWEFAQRLQAPSLLERVQLHLLAEHHPVALFRAWMEVGMIPNVDADAFRISPQSPQDDQAMHQEVRTDLLGGDHVLGDRDGDLEFLGVRKQSPCACCQIQSLPARSHGQEYLAGDCFAALKVLFRSRIDIHVERLDGPIIRLNENAFHERGVVTTAVIGGVQGDDRDSLELLCRKAGFG